MRLSEPVGVQPGKSAARGPVVAAFVLLLAGSVGVSAAVLLIGANRHLSSLLELGDRLRHCRAAASLREEGTPAGRDTTRLPSANSGLRTQRKPQPSLVGCTGVIYAWSTLMPLSERGIAEIKKAARDLGLSLHVLDASELYTITDSEPAGSGFDDSSTRGSAPRNRGDPVFERALAAELIAGGVTVHYPAIIVYREGKLLGGAIVGYKTAAAYEAMITKRLALRPANGQPEAVDPLRHGVAEVAAQQDTADKPAPITAVSGPEATLTVADILVEGRPGPYFRFVPGRRAIAFESGRIIHLLDIASGSARVAPGFVDFVPSPDGRFFVTPADRSGGLQFYDANDVFEAAARGVGANVRPFYVDRDMRDQYPSVGLLDTVRIPGASRIVYRVLTSWFDKVVFRDYEVGSNATASAIVLAVSPPVVACPDLEVSLPIMAPDGRELAARDETTSTTKIFGLADDGTCTESMDIGLPTGKVAWAPDNRRIAFAIPSGLVRDGAGVLWHGTGDGGELAGIFVFDRDELRLTRVRDSKDANRLTFPEFAGQDTIMFLLSRSPPGERSSFRVVWPVR